MMGHLISKLVLKRPVCCKKLKFSACRSQMSDEEAVWARVFSGTGGRILEHVSSKRIEINHHGGLENSD